MEWQVLAHRVAVPRSQVAAPHLAVLAVPRSQVAAPHLAVPHLAVPHLAVLVAPRSQVVVLVQSLGGSQYR